MTILGIHTVQHTHVKFIETHTDTTLFRINPLPLNLLHL